MQLLSLKYSNLVYELVARDIKTKYRRSVLGILWSILNPLCMMIITAMIFSAIFRFHIENYVLYLLSGQLLFGFYREASSFALGSIIANASLIRKVYVPRHLFPIARVLSSAVNLLLNFPALILIMLFTGAVLSPKLVLCLIPLSLLLVFTIGIGLLLAAAAVYFRDLVHFYKVLLTAFNYATPIFYPESIVPERFHFLLDYNPLYYFLKAFRAVVCDNVMPPLPLLGTCALLAAGALLVGGVFFQRRQNQFILYI